MKKAILICYHGSKNPKGKLDTKKLSKIQYILLLKSNVCLGHARSDEAAGGGAALEFVEKSNLRNCQNRPLRNDAFSEDSMKIGDFGEV